MFISPTTDIGHTDDKDENGLRSLAIPYNSAQRGTASLYNDDSTSVSELPGFPYILDDTVNSGSRPLYLTMAPSRLAESVQRDETDPTMRRPTTKFMPNVLTILTNVSSCMNTSLILATGPSAPSAPTAHSTTLESTLDVITKQPTNQMSEPDVTPSLFSPTTPEPTIVFETLEPTIIPEMPTIYETPVDQTPAPPSAQLSSDRLPSERKTRKDSPPNRRRYHAQRGLNDQLPPN